MFLACSKTNVLSSVLPGTIIRVCSLKLFRKTEMKMVFQWLALITLTMTKKYESVYCVIENV